MLRQNLHNDSLGSGPAGTGRTRQCPPITQVACGADMPADTSDQSTHLLVLDDISEIVSAQRAQATKQKPLSPKGATVFYFLAPR